MATRFDGDWEGWLKFFLRGVEEVSLAATETERLLDYLFESPMLTVRKAAEHLDCTFATAGSAIAQLEQMCSTRSGMFNEVEHSAEGYGPGESRERA